MLRFTVLSGCVLALVATVSFAQPPGGGAPGGPGGFGGMRMPASMLLQMPEVQKELDITDAQKTQLTDLRTEVQKDMQSAFSGIDFQAMRDMTPEERTKAFADLRTKGEELGKQVDTKVEKVLNEKQMNRLKQLQLQREGAAAFARPEVIKKLGLTADQQAKIKKIQDDAQTQARTQMRSAFTPNATPEERQAAMTKMQEAQAKVLKDVKDTLEVEQAMSWTEMTGKEFKFPAGMGFGGGGFGGRGGRGGAQPKPPAN